MTHDLTLQSRASVTHDTHHLQFRRPRSLSCKPGQAVDLSLMREGFRDQPRPFTPVNGGDEETIDFIIKSYPEHNGVTAQIATLQPKEKVRVSDPWGAIHDAGPGTFIAGGAGITPFIAILRARLAREGTLGGSTLIYSNKTEADIILRDEFEAMEGLETIWLVTDQTDPGPNVKSEKIDRHFLRNHATAANAPFYICGPDAMVDDIEEMLISFGIAKSDIIREDFS